MANAQPPSAGPLLARLAARRELWAVACALALLWGVGLFGRTYWTPDEPREAALAASMSAHPAALPALAGVPFAEKPPLSYWLAGAAMRLGGAAMRGPAPAAARLPQLAYALLGFLAVAALARALGAAGRVAGLLFVSAELVYQVQIWLDTDALLLGGVCVALAGMYAGLSAATGAARLRGYLLMHAGLTLAFFGKNFAAWLVPVLCFIGFIAWERRGRELLRWELYVGALLPASCIGLWVLAVASRPDGAHLLHILFWNNLVGRALPVAAEAQYSYSTGHPNWPGKYLVELLPDLLPWSAVAVAGLCAAWRHACRPGARRAAWRFALCAAVPGLLVLSLATTARSIYAAPCMAGFALLMALWAAERRSADGGVPRPGTLWVLRITALLLALPALAVLAITVALQWTVQRAGAAPFLLSALTALAVAVWSLRRVASPTVPVPRALTGMGIAWALLLSLGALSVFGAMNRTQDIQSLALRVARAAGTHPILLWHADETTLAWAQLYLPQDRWTAIDALQSLAAAELHQRLRAAPDTAVVSLIAGPGWSEAAWRDYLRGAAPMPASAPVRQPAEAAAAAAAEPVLSDAGLEAVQRVQRPGGRGYWLWVRKALPPAPVPDGPIQLGR
jgi:4-amino-4-deoxy-L-arabinose transferase-like glycosyltransferase